MSATRATVRRHRLAHIPALQVDRALFEKRFAAVCQTSNCKAVCCRGGVWVDLEERARILANAERVQKLMDAAQDRNPSNWFESGEVVDPDFPSGMAAGTQVVNDRCVFLDGANLCTLQRADAGTEGDLGLKPFFCRIFPLTLEYGVLTNDEMAAGQTQCCAVSPDGRSSVFDVCREELDHVLGADGVEELRHLAFHMRADDESC